MTWALGDLDAALAAFARDRRADAPVAAAPGRTSSASALTNLAGVRTERGELDEALAAAREGLPLLHDAGMAWSVLDHLALRAALAGKVANAARIAGFADSICAAKESPRQPNEARARTRLQALLREKLATDELERLLAEGAR